MKASEERIEDFLANNKTRFVIPVYQRNYDWNQAQCQQLFADILAAGNNDSMNAHFIGSIVFVHDDVYGTSRMKELVIIDGQQRLTTLTLIYIALYKLAQTQGNAELEQEILETYLINKFADEEEKLKLKPTENNAGAYQYLMRNHEGEAFKGYSKLINNFEFFKNKLNNDNYKTVQKGLAKLRFIEISLDRERDNPQRIFESLNSTGLELSQADLIRNYILMGLKAKDQERIYANYWAVIEDKARNIDSNENKVSDFIRDYLTLKNKKIPTKNKVYDEFKIKQPAGDLADLEESLQEIKKFALHYHKLVNPSQEQDKAIRQQLEYINRLEINVSYPFLLPVLDDYQNSIIDKHQLIEVLALVQNFVFRRFILGLPTNALNKIFMSLYDKVESNNYVPSIQKALLSRSGSQRFPRDKEIAEALRIKDVYTIKTKNRVYLLDRLENHGNNEPVLIDGNANITTEHIFPQNPDAKWKAQLSTDDYKQMQEIYLNTLANLTLSGNNGQLGNKTFADKRDMPDSGYKASRFWLNKYLAEQAQWGVAELEQRYALLLQRFFAVWPFPALNETIAMDATSEMNIFEADEPKNKKLDYAIFMDSKLEVTQVTKLYLEVLRGLFELQPEAFFTTALAERLGLVKGEQAANALRQPALLAEDYYVETNIDSNGKFERLKIVLAALGLEDELSIKYADEPSSVLAQEAL